MRLLMLKKTDSIKHEQYLRLMGHDENREKDPEYWHRTHNLLCPLIADILRENDPPFDGKHIDDISLDDVVSITLKFENLLYG